MFSWIILHAFLFYYQQVKDGQVLKDLSAQASSVAGMVSFTYFNFCFIWIPLSYKTRTCWINLDITLFSSGWGCGKNWLVQPFLSMESAVQLPAAIRAVQYIFLRSRVNIKNTSIHVKHVVLGLSNMRFFPLAVDTTLHQTPTMEQGPAATNRKTMTPTGARAGVGSMTTSQARPQAVQRPREKMTMMTNW